MDKTDEFAADGFRMSDIPAALAASVSAFADTSLNWLKNIVISQHRRCNRKFNAPIMGKLMLRNCGDRQGENSFKSASRPYVAMQLNHTTISHTFYPAPALAGDKVHAVRTFCAASAQSGLFLRKFRAVYRVNCAPAH